MRHNLIAIAALAFLAGCGSYLHDTQRTPTLDPLAARLLANGHETDQTPRRAAADAANAADVGRSEHTEANANAISPADAAATEVRAGDTVGSHNEESRNGIPDRASAFEALGDSTLAALIREAIEHQTDIQIGIATVSRSRAMAMAARAPRFPTANFVVAAGAGQSITPGIGAVSSQSLGFTLPISYEVDLFGRYAREHHAAEAQAEASEEDLAALSVTVASEVADAWFDLTMVGSRRRALESQRELQQRVLTLVEARVRQGLAAPVDLLAQQQLLATTESALVLLESEREVGSVRLRALIGRDASGPAFVVPDELPVLPAISDEGLGAERLSDRPDVRAALLRLEAADSLVTAAIRAQLPTLRLGVTPGYLFLNASRGGMSTSTSGVTWTVNGTLTVPLFDGLRARSTVLDRRAQVDEQLRRYEGLLRNAGAEVESAVALDRQARVQLEQLSSVRDLTRRTREAVEASYRQGLVDYVRVLLAMRDEVSAESSWLDATRAVLSYRLQLYKALGGDLGLSH